MHIYRSRFLTRGEVWYDHEPAPAPVDWVYYRQRSRPLAGAKCRTFYTNIIELEPESEALLQRVSKSTVYKIKRGRDKDKFACERLEPLGTGVLDEFAEAYGQFAASKNLAALDRALLEGLARDGCLELSVARSPEGKPLVYHAHYRDAQRSCLLHSVSLYKTISDSAVRNAIGRANRYLFWCDILRHKEGGLKVYDFGGWYPGHTDRELLAINRFKEEFGGKVIQEYNCEKIVTWKAFAVLTVAALMDRARTLAGKLRHSTRAERADVESEATEDAPAAALREPQAAK